MKKAFFLVLIFFIIFLSILLATAFFAMLAENCAHMKVGVETDFFNFTYFYHNIVRYLPWCAIISLMMLILYIIKHQFSVPQFVVPYFILALLIWMLVIPACSIWYDNIQKEYPIPQPDAQNLSTGYFRKDGEYLTYVTGKEGENGEEWRRKVLSEQTETNTATDDTEKTVRFADSLIENAVTSPFLWDYAHEKCLLLKQFCHSALEKGYFSYILFATLGFALSSVIFLHRFSSWRLVNALSVIIISALIIMANIHFYDPVITNKIPFLGKWWLPLTVNSTLCVLFMTIGIINWVRHPDRNREGR